MLPQMCCNPTGNHNGGDGDTNLLAYLLTRSNVSNLLWRNSQMKPCSFHITSISSPTVKQTVGGGSDWALNNRYALGAAAIKGGIIRVQEHDDDVKPLSHLGKRVNDSLILRDVSGGRDGAPLSPGDGNNLTTGWQRWKWWLLKNGASDARRAGSGAPGADVWMIQSCLYSDMHVWTDTYRSCLMLLQSTHMVGTLVLQCSWNL